MTRLAEEMTSKWITSLGWLVSQLKTTVLACIAVDMIILVHGDYSDSLVSSFKRSNGSSTCITLWSKDSVKKEIRMSHMRSVA